MLSVLLTILIFAVTISILVFIHEGGHFLMAKWARIWVHEFAIGFGPAIWRRRWGETEYTFRLLPLGGYVRMAGEDGESEEDAHIPRDRLFSAKSGWARTAVIFAGPLTNIAAAVLFMIAFVGIFGTSYVEIAEVAAGSPAQSLLQSGDKVVRLDGQEIYSASQIPTIIQRSEGRPLETVVLRGRERLHVTLDPYWSEERGRYLIGVYFTYPLNQIAELPPDSTLARQGFKPGDVILSVDDRPVGSWTDFIVALGRVIQDRSVVSVTVLRDGETTRLSVEASQIDLSALRDAQFAPGIPVPATWPIVDRVESGSLWSQQGIRAGDRFVSAHGEPLYSLASLIKAVQRARGGDGRLELRIERDGAIRRFELDVRGLSLEEALTGLQFQSAQRRPASVWASASIGARQIWNVLVLTYFGIKQVITGQMGAGEAFVGPVGIADLLGRSLDLGPDYFIRLVAILSLMLGIFNLLPFPALDGSRIVFVAVNGLLKLIVGRPIPPEKEGWIHYVGFMLLMLLVLVITWNDIQRLFQGGF